MCVLVCLLTFFLFRIFKFGTNIVYDMLYCVQGFPLEFYFRGHKSPLTLIQGDILGDFRGQSYDT